MFKIQVTIMFETGYQSYSLCSFAHEPHGPLTRPYKTNQIDAVIRMP